MSLSLEMASNNPIHHKNLAVAYGFDASSVIWSDDPDVQVEIKRLCSHATLCPDMGCKSFSGLDLSNEKPFNLRTAVFEDVDLKDLKFPVGTDLSAAKFTGCNLYGVNLKDCKIEE